MEVLEILEKSSRELYLEDLDFFEAELATGSYTDGYKKRCREKIAEIRRFLVGEDEHEEASDATLPHNLVVGIDRLVPQGMQNSSLGMTEEEVILHTIRALRGKQGYKTEFKHYIKSAGGMDEAFIEQHFTFFTDLELDAIVMTVALSEAFLEKYFGAFAKDKIARYQTFSEQFFMKHFADLDYNIVLTEGKNEWREKAKRSRQLDVFLRLKGITI